jgi:hypothetical protein
MAIANPYNGSVTTQWYVKEVEPGVTPDNPVWTQLQLTGGAPLVTKEALISAQLGGGGEVNAIRLADQDLAGEFSAELAYAAYDDLLESAMSNTWVAGVDQAGVEITVDSTLKTFTRSTGDFVSDGVRVNDYIVFPDLTGQNGKAFVVSAVDATTVTGASIALELADETVTTDYKTSDQLTQGGLCETISTMIWFKGSCGAADAFMIFTGVKMTGYTVEAAINSFITSTFPFLGDRGEIVDAPPAGSTYLPIDALSVDKFSSADGRIMDGNDIVGFMDSETITNDTASSKNKYLGGTSSINRGLISNTLSISGKLNSLSYVQRYFDETPLKVSLAMEFGGRLLAFSHNNAKITNAGYAIDAPEDATQNIEAQAIGDANNSSIVVHRLSY